MEKLTELGESLSKTFGGSVGVEHEFYEIPNDREPWKPIVGVRETVLTISTMAVDKVPDRIRFNGVDYLPEKDR